jgi:small basic protein
MGFFEAITTGLPMIQYPAAVLTCAGYYFVGSTTPFIRKYGFTLGIIGNIIWMIYALAPVQLGIIITNAFVFAFGVRGYVNNSYIVDLNLLEYMRKHKFILKKRENL